MWPLVENFTILGVDLGLPHRGPSQRVSHCKESYSPSLLQLAHAQPRCWLCEETACSNRCFWGLWGEPLHCPTCVSFG